jgi:hypothetical protein
MRFGRVFPHTARERSAEKYLDHRSLRLGWAAKALAANIQKSTPSDDR